MGAIGGNANPHLDGVTVELNLLVVKCLAKLLRR